MSDYKDYVVRYDIQANVDKATEGFGKIAAVAEKFRGPMNILKEAVQEVNSALRALKSHGKFEFTPQIDPRTFNSQLKSMVLSVRSAATEMQSDLRKAFNLSASAGNAMKQGIEKSLGSKSIQQLERDIKVHKERIDQLYGTPKKGKGGKAIRARDGLIQYAKNAKNEDKVISLMAEGKAIRKQLANEEAELAALKQIDKEVAATQAKNAKSSQKTAASTTSALNQTAKLTNVTPAVIREWGKVFGNSKVKSLTVNIYGKADGTKGAITVIDSVKKALGELEALGKFDIVPTPNKTAFTQVEQELGKLKTLSESVMAPFVGDTTKKQGAANTFAGLTKEEQEKLRLAQNNTKTLKDKINGVQQRLDANKAKLTQQSPSILKANIARDESLLTKYQKELAAHQNDIDQIQSKVPQGVQGQQKNIKPLAVDIIGNLTSVNTNGKEFVVPVIGEITKLQPPKNAEIPISVKVMADQVNESLRSLPRPSLTVNVHLNTDGIAKQLQTINATSISVTPKQPEWKKSAERVKKLDDAVATFQRGLTPFEQTEYQKDKKIRQAKNTADHERRANKLRAQAYNSMLPFATNQNQLNTLVKYRKFFQQAQKVTGIRPTQGMQAQQMLQYLQGVTQQMHKVGVQIPWQLQNQINKLNQQINKVSNATAAASSAASKQKVKTVRVAEKPVSIYDRARKWAYPFTGNTSFGATTPMAVDMAKGMGVMFAVGGAMSAVGNSFNEAVEYQNTMRTTKAILENGTDTYTPSAFVNMERTVRDVGVKTKFSAPEVASAARFLAMAGYDIAEINHAIQPIADLALIGDTDLGETADKMTNIMTTFGIKPEKMREAANIMTTTATRSNTDLMMLAESAKYGGGVANMYGYNDPNLFADTMALFGVMGNAGIQASSAGTALRMMYQNIYKPNKTQKAVLEQLNKDYGISTLDSFGNFRAMSDILVEMATRIPEDKMAQIVGNLFRITAQPGAAATLRAAAQEDNTDVEQVAGGINAVSDFVKDKGLSSLVELMLANRESISGNISGNIALEKQSTIKGLWDQVTSTFTESILIAFEKNEGFFTKKLMELRDYLSKPETVQMVQRLFDLIIKIGEVMATFIEYWVKLYNMFPGIVEQWIKWQMIFTQIGSLISPLVSVISVIDRLSSSLMTFSGVAAATAKVNAWNTATSLGGVATNTVGLANTYANIKRTNTPKIRQLEQDIQNQLMLYGLAGSSTKDILNWIAKNKNSDLAKSWQMKEKLFGELDAARLQKRNQQMSNPELLSRVASRQLNNSKSISGYAKGLNVAYKAGAAYMSLTGLANMASSIKTMFTGLMVSLAKAVGMLVNPFTLVLGAIGGLGIWIYKLAQHANSATETQIRARKQLGEDFTQSFNAEKERHKNVQNFLSKNGFVTAKMNDYQEDVENIKNKQNKFASSYQYLFNKDIITSDGASRKSNKDIVDSLRKRYVDDATIRLALDEKEYKELLGNGLAISSEKFEKDMVDISKNRTFDINHSALDNLISAQIYNKATGERNATIELLNKAAVLAVKNEGANDEKILQARNQIVELRKKLGDTEQFRNQAMTILNNTVNPNDYKLLGDEYINLTNLESPNFDWSQLQSYAWAGYRVLMSEINASKGSVVDSILAMEELKKGLVPYSEQWGNAISRLVDNFRIIRNITFNGKVYDNIEVLMKTLPDGRLDFSNILKQIQDKIEGFKGNTKLFVEFANKVYQMLLDMGIMTDDTIEARKEFVKKQLNGKGLSDKEIEQYYIPTEDDKKRENEERRRKSDPFGYNQVNIPEKPNDFGNTWINYQNNMLDMMPEQSPQIPMAPDPTDSYLPTWAKDRARKENNALENMIGKDAQQYVKQLDKAKGKNGNGSVNDGNANNPNGNGTTGTNLAGNSTTDQNEYSSKYTSSSARPTQIVFNIDKLANFDRTTVAANAEERDLMASLETKIAETVYRIFAEAQNSANHMIRG